MNFFRKLFKRKKPTPRIEQLTILNFKFLHNNEEINPSIKMNYHKLSTLLEPKYVSSTSWTHVYSTSRCGYSLKTMYMFLKSYDPPYVIVVEDVNGDRFGCFFDMRVGVRKGTFGIYSTFLFKVEDEFKRDKKNINNNIKSENNESENKTNNINSAGIVENYYYSSHDENERIKIFKATGKNKYYCTATPTHLAFGVANGYHGLLLGQDMRKGETHSVETFDNDLLCKNTHFYIKEVEVWSIDNK